MNMRKIKLGVKHRIFILIGALIGVVCFAGCAKSAYPQTTVTINDYQLVVDEAITDEQQTRGLAVKKQLAEDQGMLFMYDHEQPLAFWMKDMRFPIDIIWLDGQKRVVHIEQNLAPCLPNRDCPSYLPTENAQYVLETVAGFTQKHHVVIGQTVVW